MNQLNGELLKLFTLGKMNQQKIIERLDDLFVKFGTFKIEKWRNLSNKKNTLLHELVERDLSDIIRHVVQNYQVDINIQRDTDQLTPFQLALENNNTEMCSLLKELGAEEILNVDVAKLLLDEDRGKSMNIAWVDLEMTSIENPEILECAVIITDKDLRELERGKLIIGF
jgi:hypothetical protein